MSYGDYGEPWGLGFLGDVFNKDDLKNAGLLMGGGAVAFTLAPWALSLIKSSDSNSFLGKHGVWIKTAASVAGGYALYKWGKGGGSVVKDLGFAAGAVLLALGGSTVLKKVLDMAGVKAPEGMIALGEYPSEGELLAALNAIEDQPLLGMGEYAPLPLAEGFQVPESAYAGLDAYGPTEFSADEYPEYAIAGMDADVASNDLDGVQIITDAYDGIDADVVGIDDENPAGFLYMQ
jgi:hypothetical protein